jgi:hypothetical protein
VQPDEQITLKDQKRSRRAINLELFYYEQLGSRYYLRVTPFAIILILVALVFGLTILYLDGQKQGMPDNRIAPTLAAPSLPSNTIIQQAPPPPPAAIVRQHKVAKPSPPTLPSSIRNSNER